MTFRGWTARVWDFYEGLAADNSKAYWERNKDVYKAEVQEPMAELLDEIGDEFGEGKIHRLQRDVRFSTDKTPYKTVTCASLPSGGYILLSAEGLATGSGYQSMAPDQLDRYRRAVDDEESGGGLRDVIAGIEGRGIEVRSDEQLKAGPRGYPKEHPRADLLRYKDLTAWQRWPMAEWLATPDAKEHVIGALRATRPLSDWLETHVGAAGAGGHDGRRRAG